MNKQLLVLLALCLGIGSVKAMVVDEDIMAVDKKPVVVSENTQNLLRYIKEMARRTKTCEGKAIIAAADEALRSGLTQNQFSRIKDRSIHLFRQKKYEKVARSILRELRIWELAKKVPARIEAKKKAMEAILQAKVAYPQLDAAVFTTPVINEQDQDRLEDIELLASMVKNTDGALIGQIACASSVLGLTQYRYSLMLTAARRLSVEKKSERVANALLNKLSKLTQIPSWSPDAEAYARAAYNASINS